MVSVLMRGLEESEVNSKHHSGGGHALYATPQQIFQRALSIEHEAETYASVGLGRIAADLNANARTLRQLARQANAKLGRLGE